jgi:hypothetical protein
MVSRSIIPLFVYDFLGYSDNLHLVREPQLISSDASGTQTQFNFKIMMRVGRESGQKNEKSTNRDQQGDSEKWIWLIRRRN